MSSAHKVAALSLVSPAVAAVEGSVALDEVNALHRTMSVRIIRLEVQLEEVDAGRAQPLFVSYMRWAIVLRNLLTRASGLADVLPEVIPSFEQLLTEAILWGYRWAVSQLVDVRRLCDGQLQPASRSIPLEALSVFHDLSELCAASAIPADAQFIKTLHAIDHALYRLISIRDRLEQILRTEPR